MSKQTSGILEIQIDSYIFTWFLYFFKEDFEILSYIKEI